MKINEVTHPPQNPKLSIKLKNIHDFIQANCSKYLNDIRDPKYLKLYRGIDSPLKTRREKNVFRSAMLVKPRAERRPKDTSPVVHDMIVKAFKDAGFIANRDNSLFCSGSIYTGEGYSSYLVKPGQEESDHIKSLFVVYPVGDYHITWSSEVEDFTNSFGNESDLYRRGVYNISNLENVIIPSLKLIDVLQIIRYYDDNKMVDWLDIANKFMSVPKNKELVDSNKVTLEYLLRTNPSHDYEEGLELLKNHYYYIGDIKHAFPNILISVGDMTKITNLFRTDNIRAAIDSNNEIMVKAEKVFLVRADYDKLIWNKE